VPIGFGSVEYVVVGLVLELPRDWRGEVLVLV
jgi:hypothetical protein